MRKVKVITKNDPYQIYIEHGSLLKFATIFQKENHNQNWIIATQNNLDKLYGQSLKRSLMEAGFYVKTLIIPDGESTKTITQIENIYTQLLELHCDRSTVLIALGGGVVGDVIGFVASTFMRGIKYIQVPTTLLAMIDSAIGGKTGVNLSLGKNLVGSIYQPLSVLVDPKLLNTLPARELISGFAEMVKYGLIKDPKFFGSLTDSKFNIGSYKQRLMESAITISCKIKADIVSKDEKEISVRRILNFGHTIGHALENYYGYNKLRHGEAVAYGMLCSSWISLKKGKISNIEWDTIENTIRELPLPKVENIDSEKVLNIIKHDKKNQNGILHFILLNGIGNAVISDQVSDIEILESLNQIKLK